MLQVEGVTIAYPPNPPILHDISFSLAEGSITALMGSSGLGKTSLLHLFAGLLKPAAGHVTAAATFKTTVMFQEDRLLPWVSAVKNVVLGMPQPDEQAAGRLLKRMDIADIHALPAALSGGMKRRVALARALLAGGDLLLLDEPFTGADDAMKENLSSVILESGKTVLFSTHDERDAALMRAQILLLRHDGARLLP